MAVEARLIGVNLVGPPPIDDLWFRLEDSVNVLYGRNGAGKSAILQGLRSAFSGIRGPGGVAQILVHVPPSFSGRSWRGLGEVIADVVHRNGKAFARRWPEDGYPDLGSALRASLWDRVLEDWVGEWPEPDLRVLLDEVVSQGLFFLVSAGVAEPRWRVRVAARRDESTPAVNSAIAAQEVDPAIGSPDLDIGVFYGQE